jgi:DNA-binding NtrC family response regulator
MLPDADGVELLGHLRAKGVNAPAIIITAHPSFETAVEALGLRAAHYLQKPFAREELLSPCLRGARHRRETPRRGDEAGYLWQTFFASGTASSTS